MGDLMSHQIVAARLATRPTQGSGPTGHLKQLALAPGFGSTLNGMRRLHRSRLRENIPVPDQRLHHRSIAMSARPRGALIPGAHGHLVEQFVLELATLRSRTHRLLSRRGRIVVDPLAELRSDSSGLGDHVLSLMDEVQESFRRIRRKFEG
jgi:hypothetical protein